MDAITRDPVNPKIEDEEIWSGMDQRTVGVAPLLTSHVASQLKDRAGIDKQRSKAAAIKKGLPKGGKDK